MQFVKRGPDIPERLLQAHEDGQVVFFCGAGISYPAGLPTFTGLVDRLYEDMGIDPDPVEAKAIKGGQYDTAVGLLEAKVMGGRQTVRKALARILTPNLTARNATATHQALLTLGRSRDARTRLVTTNFDRLFEEVISTMQLSVESFRAPLLPIPKNRWDGLVYLHGLLTANPVASDLERLVVSSGDFGLAYLTERWAARFVSELLRNYTVCFVGYSINDPVLRYMMDALAADRVLGESPPEMFAFGSYSKGKKADRAREWQAKNVTPVLYPEHLYHAYLHRTLRAWSETYRDGARGKEQIVVECAIARPLASTEQDDFVGRLIWALSDPSGLPAKRFAELNPVPSLDWLEPLSEGRFGHADLDRFGVPPKATVNEELAFSLTRRPTPYDLAPLMALVAWGTEQSRWDNVMVQIARWLIRHLDDPALLLWLVKRGGSLQDGMARYIETRLEELVQLETNDPDKLERIRANAPKAIPRPGMRTLWHLLLSGRVGTSGNDLDLYRWRKRLKQDGFTTTLRLELREKLTPRVSFSEPFPWPDEGREEVDESRHMARFVRADIVLSTNHVRPILQELASDELWTEALPELLPDFTGLLRDALDLWRELGYADDKNDQSYACQPSISEHPQNTGFRDWTVLIELVRDAWLAMCALSPEGARAAAQTWWKIPYPTFRRLAFFAAVQDDVIPRRQALDWLLADESWWLWSPETLREAMRLLVGLAPRLEEAELAQLERAILTGPPRVMYRADIEPASWVWIQERDIWLRLGKVAGAGARLSVDGIERLEALSGQYPDWQLSENERDEFSTWIGYGSELREYVTTPREPRELIEWLIANADTDVWQQDDWSERCREEFDATASALSELTLRGIWPRRRWREALNTWSEEELRCRSWDRMASVLARAPSDGLRVLNHGIAWWLQAVAKTCEIEEETFLSLCDGVLGLNYEDEQHDDGADVVGRAINHPVGLVTEALLRWWYRKPLKDDQRLGDNLSSRFSRICDTRISKFRHGRVLLARHVIALFRVDPNWAIRNVLPLFNWQLSRAEARFAWEGFLWSPRFYRPLMEALKPAFLDTANYCAELGEHGAQYPSLLTFAALDPGGVFTRRELATATAALTQEGRENAAETLVQGLAGAGAQAADYWRNRVVPYLRSVWPRLHDVASPAIAESFARACVEAGDAFPEALEEVRNWLQPLPFPGRILRRLYELNLHERFPGPTLELLDVVVGDDVRWPPPGELLACMRTIRATEPELKDDHRFQRLAEYLRAHGQSSD